MGGLVFWCSLIVGVYVFSCAATLKLGNVSVADAPNHPKSLIGDHHVKSQGHGNATLETSVKEQNSSIVYRKNKADEQAEREKKLMAEITKLELKKPSKTTHKNTAKQRPGSEAPGESSRPQPCCEQGQGCSSCIEKPEQFVPDIYSPSWRSIDRRPIPSWYEDAKFGIFVHWGVYSVPSFGNEWFWYRWKEGWPDYVEFMDKNYPPGFSYAEFAPKFKAEFFDADKWARLVARSGAR